MAQYKILERSYIRLAGSRHARIVLPNEIIAVDDSVIPAPHWEPLDDAAKAAAARAATQGTGTKSNGLNGPTEGMNGPEHGHNGPGRSMF